MKVRDIKRKVSEKITKAKRKVSRKCGKAVVPTMAAATLGILCGCQNPAQRAITIETNIYAYEGGSVTFGGGDVGSAAQANETGGNDAGMTASPTNDVKPDVDVTVGGASSGSGILDTAKSIVNAVSGSSGTATTAASSSECTDGSCEYCTVK